MLQWLRSAFIQYLGKKAAFGDAKAAFENVKRQGNSDAICERVLAKIDGDTELKKFIDSVGVREALLPFDRTTISFAAINSLMLARKDLLTNSSSNAPRRLEDARRVFRYSFLIFDEIEFAAEAEKQAQGIVMMLSGKPRPSSLYEERMRQAEDALPRWMSADVHKHAFIS
ncbi:hypothetical protein ACU8MT_15695 [Rhizobium leguminosarum]